MFRQYSMKFQVCRAKSLDLHAFSDDATLEGIYKTLNGLSEMICLTASDFESGGRFIIIGG